MSITRDQINTAMTRFLDRGGSIRRYERLSANQFWEVISG